MQFDVLQPITITGLQSEATAMWLRTAQSHSVGLSFLYKNVRIAEQKALRLCDEECGEDRVAWVYGDVFPSHPGLLALVECAFRWYSVTACDFVRVATALAAFDDAQRRAYEDDVLGAVKAFRDKVGAHTAGLTKNRHDNSAERLFTPCLQVAFDGTRFVTGELTMHVSRDGKSSDTMAIAPWSLTNVHEQLIARYPLLQADPSGQA